MSLYHKQGSLGDFFTKYEPYSYNLEGSLAL